MIYRRRIFLSIASLAAMAVGKIFLIVAIVNFLGIEAQGGFTFLLAIVIGLSVFLSAGSEISNGYYIAREPECFASVILNNSRLLLFAIFLAVPFSILYFSFLLPADLQLDPARIGLIFLITLLAHLASLQLQGFLTGLGRFDLILVGNILQYGGAILVIVQAHTSDVVNNVECALLAWAIGCSLKAAWIIWVLRGAIRLVKNKHEKNLVTLGEQITYGRYVVLSNLANVLNFRFDAYILAYFVTPESLGFYSLGLMLSEAILYLPKALGQVLFSVIASSKSNTNNRRFILLGVGATTIVGLATSAIGPFFLSKLFFVQETNAIQAIVMLCIAATIFGASQILIFLAFGKGQPKHVAICALISSIINVSINIALVPNFGIIGAAFASLISYSLYGILLVWISLPVLKISCKSQRSV